MTPLAAASTHDFRAMSPIVVLVASCACHFWTFIKVVNQVSTAAHLKIAPETNSLALIEI